MKGEAPLRLGRGLSSARDITGVSGHRQRPTSWEWALMSAVRPPLPVPSVFIMGAPCLAALMSVSLCLYPHTRNYLFSLAGLLPIRSPPVLSDVGQGKEGVCGDWGRGGPKKASAFQESLGVGGVEGGGR